MLQKVVQTKNGPVLLSFDGEEYRLYNGKVLTYEDIEKLNKEIREYEASVKP